MIDDQRGQSIHNAISHYRTLAVCPCIVYIFYTLWSELILSNFYTQSQWRHIARAHDSIIHQLARENLSLIAEEHLFAQRFTQPLCHAAVHLALDDHRVNDYAAVVHQHELPDGRLAGFAIDAHHGHVRAEAPGFASRIEEYRLLETGLYTGRDPSAVRRCRDLAPRDFFVRDTGNGEATVGLRHVFRRGFH